MLFVYAIGLICEDPSKRLNIFHFDFDEEIITQNVFLITISRTIRQNIIYALFQVILISNFFDKVSTMYLWSRNKSGFVLISRCLCHVPIIASEAPHSSQ